MILQFEMPESRKRFFKTFVDCSIYRLPSVSHFCCSRQEIYYGTNIFANLRNVAFVFMGLAI